MGGGCFECPRIALSASRKKECRRKISLAQGSTRRAWRQRPIDRSEVSNGVAGVVLGCEEFPSAREGGQGLRRTV